MSEGKVERVYISLYNTVCTIYLLSKMNSLNLVSNLLADDGPAVDAISVDCSASSSLLRFLGGGL